MSILYKARPDEVKMVMVDPKRIELDVYNGIPHLIQSRRDRPEKGGGRAQVGRGRDDEPLQALFRKFFAQHQSYNEYAAENGEKYLPSIVIIIDELADIMMCAPHEVEDAICRLAQMARAAGIYLVIATQRPSVDVITGIIKANIPRASPLRSQARSIRALSWICPARKNCSAAAICSICPSAAQSRCACRAVSSATGKSGAWSSPSRSSRRAVRRERHEEIERNASETQSPGEGGEGGDQEYDAMFPDAVEAVVDAGLASVSLLQRRLKLGYSRAARIVDRWRAAASSAPTRGASRARCSVRASSGRKCR